MCIQNDVIDILVTMMSVKNKQTGAHLRRIKHYSKEIFGYLTDIGVVSYDYDRIDVLAELSMLHDIGKLGIADRYLEKTQALEPHEIDAFRKHLSYGKVIIDKLQGILSDENLNDAYDICLYHHERADGKGYPQGLKEESIPLTAQVVALADVYDALRSQRSYKSEKSHRSVVKMILNDEAGAFSQTLKNALVNTEESLNQIYLQYKDL